jgi:monoamine oxidase
MPFRFDRSAGKAARRALAYAEAWREQIDLTRRLLRPMRRHKRVVVIGAGFAGLACADRLVRLGHQVVLLEAREQPGGRSRTVRQPFAAGLHADAGGPRFHDHDARVWRCVRRFGLETEPFFPANGFMVAHIGGVRKVRASGESLRAWCPRELTDEERWIFEQETEARFSKVVAGIDRLSAAMADRLGSRVSYSSEAVRLEQTADTVRVMALVAGARQPLEAEHVVCAVPFSVLRRLEVSPSFSPEKSRLVESLPYASAMQFFVQYARRPWERDGLNGFAVTDTIGEIWHPTYGSTGPRAVLVGYAKSDLARRLKPISNDGRIRAAVDAIEASFQERAIASKLPSSRAGTRTSGRAGRRRGGATFPARRLAQCALPKAVSTLPASISLSVGRTGSKALSNRATTLLTKWIERDREPRRRRSESGRRTAGSPDEGSWRRTLTL